MYSSGPSILQPVAVWGEKGAGPGQFNEPRGIAVDGSGTVYVVDSKNNRIQKLAADGTPLLMWGHEGSGPGEFKDPCGITAGSDGSVYVADTWNHRVQKFTATGQFVSEMRPQAGFWGPRGIAIAPDNSAVYVTDTGNKRVVSFDPNGKELVTWGHDGSKPGEFIEPVGIAVDENGQVAVADTGNHRIQYFDRQGKFVKEHFVSGWEEFYSEPYVAILGPDLLVTDSYNHRCARYSHGNLVYSWGKSGMGQGDFNRPIGIATDKQGAVYVTDTMNHRIEKFALPPVVK
jgi:DNA-binding beta-propeller fold protein YncE